MFVSNFKLISDSFICFAMSETIIRHLFAITAQKEFNKKNFIPYLLLVVFCVWIGVLLSEKHNKKMPLNI